MTGGREMKDRINKNTKLCMSLSARPGNFGTRFQNYLYQELGLDFVYKSFTTSDLPAAIGGVRALGIRGCAISMPFKEACIPLLEGLDASAAAIKSVNTIVNDGGRLTGYNTDYIAIERLIEKHAIPRSASVLLRGSGGMSKAVASAFRDQGFQNVTLVARNEASGPALAETLGFGWRREPGDASADVLVNVTPIGMAGGSESADLAFPEGTIAAASLVFEVVATPAETPLLLAARRLGKPTIAGTEVLVLQGLEQFVLYTDVRPTAEQIARAAEFALSS